jgi:tetratricopeptide (TPR) repeat protein
MAKRPAQRDPTVEALKEKMARDPFSRAFLQLAEEYRRAGEYEEAIKVCLDGLQRHPTYHTARITLGRTYLECGNLEEARRTLGEVVAIAPENHLAAKLLAEVHRKLGDTAAAAETYRAILAHYPGDIEVKALLQDLIDGAAAVKPPVAPPAARPPTAPPAVTRPAVPPAVTRQVAPPVPSAPRPVDPVLDYHSDDLAAVGLGKPPGGSPRFPPPA